MNNEVELKEKIVYNHHHHHHHNNDETLLTSFYVSFYVLQKRATGKELGHEV